MRRPIDAFSKISSTHGSYAPGSRFGKHIGTDYVVMVGTGVKAPTELRITETPTSSTVGVQVIGTDSKGRIHRFLHLSKILCRVGQVVPEGTLMALSGNTGSYSTGPHLHWDVRKGGTAWNASFTNYYDPEALVRDESWKVTTVVSPACIGRILWLKPTISSWRVYPLGVRPQAGREIATLNPAKYGGLAYRILAVSAYPQTVVIETQMYGKVNIFVDSDAEIR